VKLHPNRPSDATIQFIWCPGCDHAHPFHTGSDGWAWNGDVERPTFSPSLLVYSRATLIDNTLEGDSLTAPSNVRQLPRCHSFVTDGSIQFLGDSTHALAGQTVDLPDWRYG
jgi:hypothetical protein